MYDLYPLSAKSVSLVHMLTGHMNKDLAFSILSCRACMLGRAIRFLHTSFPSVGDELSIRLECQSLHRVYS